MNSIENIEDRIESLEDRLEKAKAELEFSKFLEAFKEFIPDPKGSKEYNSYKQQTYHPRRIVQFFLKGRQFFISDIPVCKDIHKIRTITIPIDNRTNDFLKDLKNVLEKHKDILGPITNDSPE